MSSFAIVSVEKESMEKESERISKLKAPTMALKGGHTKEVLSVAFNSEGNCLASAGADKHICLFSFFLKKKDCFILFIISALECLWRL